MRNPRPLRPTAPTPLEGRVVPSLMAVMPARRMPAEIVSFGASAVGADLTTVRASASSTPQLIVATAGATPRPAAFGSAAVATTRASAKLIVGTQSATTLHTRPTFLTVSSARAGAVTQHPATLASLGASSASRTAESSARVL